MRVLALILCILALAACAPDSSGTNRSPVLDPIGNRTIQAGSHFFLALNAYDPDGDPLTYSVVGQLPAGSSFDGQAHVFEWTPDASQVGLSVMLTFLVSDGELSDSETVVFDVKGPGS